MTYDEWNDASDAKRFNAYFKLQRELAETQDQRSSLLATNYDLRKERDRMTDGLAEALGSRDLWRRRAEVLGWPTRRKWPDCRCATPPTTADKSDCDQ
jgi:hypothetical protein